MSDDPSFKMSQDYEIVPLQKKRAYPILIEEWEHLKEKISKIHDNANFYHTIGSVFLGVGGSAFIAALTLQMPPEVEGKMAIEILISWFIFAASLVCGFLSLHFGKSQRKIQNANTGDVIEHMELIEKRYETET